MVLPVDPGTTAARLIAMLQRPQEAGGAARASPAALIGAPPPVDRSDSRQASSRQVSAEWSLAETFRARAKAISPDHPDRRKATTRLLVEAILSREFGSQVTSDAGYQAVIDDVVGLIGVAPGLSADLDRVLKHLLDGA